MAHRAGISGNVLRTRLGRGGVKNHSRGAWNLSEGRWVEKIFVFALLKMSTNPNQLSGTHDLCTGTHLGKMSHPDVSSSTVFYHKTEQEENLAVYSIHF